MLAACISMSRQLKHAEQDFHPFSFLSNLIYLSWVGSGRLLGPPKHVLQAGLTSPSQSVALRLG